MNSEPAKLNGEPQNPETANSPEIHPAIMQAIRDHVGKVKDLVEMVQRIASELCLPEDGSLPTEEEFNSDTWNELKKQGKFFAMMNARKKGVPEKEVRRFLWTMILPFLSNGNYGTVYRMLNNTQIATPELCEFVGQKAVDALFANRGASLSVVDIEDELKDSVKGATLLNPLYIAAVTRLKALQDAPFQSGAEKLEMGEADRPAEGEHIHEEEFEDDEDYDDDEELEAAPPTAAQIRLQERRESGEISPHDFDLNVVYNCIEAGFPVRRSDLQNQALVLSRQNIDQLGGYVDVVMANGHTTRIDLDNMTEPVIVFFPEDLGN